MPWDGGEGQGSYYPIYKGNHLLNGCATVTHRTRPGCPQGGLGSCSLGTQGGFGRPQTLWPRKMPYLPSQTQSAHLGVQSPELPRSRLARGAPRSGQAGDGTLLTARELPLVGRGKGPSLALTPWDALSAEIRWAPTVGCFCPQMKTTLLSWAPPDPCFY